MLDHSRAHQLPIWKWHTNQRSGWQGLSYPRRTPCHRWVEQFKGVLNHPAPTTAFDLGFLDPLLNLPVNLDTITVAEMKNAIRTLNNGKAAGLDEIPPELLKSGDQYLVEALTDLLRACWADSAVPEEWKQGMIIAFLKKGDLSKCDNWRGIAVLMVPGKVFSIVLLNHI